MQFYFSTRICRYGFLLTNNVASGPPHINYNPISSAHFFIIQLPTNPSHNQPDKKFDLPFIQRPAFFDAMPLLNAFPATSCCRMLSDEYRMPSHRGLFAIILRKVGRNPGIYKLKRVFFDGFKTFGGNIVSVFL